MVTEGKVQDVPEGNVTFEDLDIDSQLVVGKGTPSAVLVYVGTPAEGTTKEGFSRYGPPFLTPVSPVEAMQAIVVRYGVDKVSVAGPLGTSLRLNAPYGCTQVSRLHTPAGVVAATLAHRSAFTNLISTAVGLLGEVRTSASYASYKVASPHNLAALTTATPTAGIA